MPSHTELGSIVSQNYKSIPENEVQNKLDIQQKKESF